MNIDQDSVPSTIEQAAAAIVSAADEQTRQFICETSAEHLLALSHMHLGRYIRNNWSLWEKDTPLKNDAVIRYQIAHADDISSLILAWAAAIIRSEPFEPMLYCKRFHDHWSRYGMSALQAGGM